MSKHTHLTQVERYQISVLLRSGKSIREIAKQLGQDKSTLYKKVNCNKDLQGYRFQQAHEKASYCLRNSHRHIKITQKVICKIKKFLVLFSISYSYKRYCEVIR